MTAEQIDGRKVAAELFAETAADAADHLHQYGRKPCLATVLVGDDPHHTRMFV